MHIVIPSKALCLGGLFYFIPFRKFLNSMHLSQHIHQLWLAEGQFATLRAKLSNLVARIDKTLEVWDYEFLFGNTLTVEHDPTLGKDLSDTLKSHEYKALFIPAIDIDNFDVLSFEKKLACVIDYFNSYVKHIQCGASVFEVEALKDCVVKYLTKLNS